MQKLRASGHEVLLVQTVPRWIGDDQWTIEQCTIAEVADGGCVQTMPLSHAEARQGAVRGHVRQVAESEGARVLDTWPMICEGDECSTQADGFARYKDSGHISVEQSKALAGEFARYF